jgi:hypothetical protein
MYSPWSTTTGVAFEGRRTHTAHQRSGVRWSCRLIPALAPRLMLGCSQASSVPLTLTEFARLVNEAALAKYVPSRGQKNACAAGFAPDSMIGGAWLGLKVIPGMKLLVVDD